MAAIRPPRDVNMEIAGLLHDLAYVQLALPSRQGYKRAAKALLTIDAPIDSLAKAGILPRIPFVGPATERIIREYLATGRSASVEVAVRNSGRAREVALLHRLRVGFLSRAAVEAVLGRKPARSAATVSVERYRGDFQMHSEWSDGAESLEGMITACLQLGYRCAAMTDHSYGLPIAGGVSMHDIARQQIEIDRLNRKYRGRFRLFKGIEANIRSDGTIDMQPGELRLFEIVVASPHSLLRRSADQTGRMVAAVSQPGVNILGHPRGRMYSRQGVLADWDAVFAAAAQRRVAVEIDGDWWRQDLDFSLAARALDRGCLFALDSDAHSGAELHYARYALAHARLARIPADRIINCWSDDRILEWAAGAWKR